jgi:hypothetical protein
VEFQRLENHLKKVTPMIKYILIVSHLFQVEFSSVSEASCM